MLIDTHSHLDFTDFDRDRDAVLQRAREAGVERLVSIGTTPGSSRAALALAEKHSQIFAAVGIHPCQVERQCDSALDSLTPLLQHPQTVALGECGLDFYRQPERAESESETYYHSRLEEWRQRQKLFFSGQLRLAHEHGLNVVVHQRESWDACLEVIAPWQGRLRVVFHCFGGSYGQAMTLIEQGHLVSFTGIVSFKNAVQVQDTVRRIPSGSFMLETDCPYLAPVPHRGKRCEPAYVKLVAETVAALRGEPLEQIITETGETAQAFFRFPADTP